MTEYARSARMRKFAGRYTYLDTLDSREVDFLFGVGMPVGFVGHAEPSTTAHLEGMPGWVVVSRSLNHAIYLRAHPRNADNFAKIERYYADQGVRFDRKRGIDVAATVADHINWALAHDMLPPGQAERMALRPSPDRGARAAGPRAVAPGSGAGEQPLWESPPRRSGEEEDSVAEHEGEESPEDDGVADPGIITVLHPLQDLLLAEGDEQRSVQPLQRVVEPGGLLTLKDQVDHPGIKGVIEHGQGQPQQAEHADP